MNGQNHTDTGSLSPHMALARATYEWALEEGLTPLVMVDVTVSGVEVPMVYAKEGKIVLNIHPNSVRDLVMDHGCLLFSARFSGRSMNITLPLESVLAVYARENGQGVVFQPGVGGIALQSSPDPGRERKGKTEPARRLKVVK